MTGRGGRDIPFFGVGRHGDLTVEMSNAWGRLPGACPNTARRTFTPGSDGGHSECVAVHVLDPADDAW